MRVYRRRKKQNGFDQSSGQEPLPDIVYQMGAEAAARFVAENRRSGNNFIASGGVYNLPAVFPAVPIAAADELEEFEEPELRSSSPVNFMRSALRRNRSKSRGRDRFTRVGSPEQFAGPVRGSPAHFQARAGSPYMFAHPEPIGSPVHFQARAGSPYMFAHPEPIASSARYMQPAEEPLIHSRSQHFSAGHSNNPDVNRRLQRAQFSQDLQRMEQEQRIQVALMRSNPVQYGSPFPPMQQSYYPNHHMQSWPMMQQSQPQMYSYY